jgi:hypothetical protein
MFRNTVSESLLATLECSENRVPLEPVSQTATPSDGTVAGNEYVVIEPKDITGPRGQSNRTVFFLVQPIRTAMRTWSGTEDVMKGGLEVAKRSCKHRSVKFPHPPAPVGPMDTTRALPHGNIRPRPGLAERPVGRLCTVQ